MCMGYADTSEFFNAKVGVILQHAHMTHPAPHCSKILALMPTVHEYTCKYYCYNKQEVPLQQLMGIRLDSFYGTTDLC